MWRVSDVNALHRAESDFSLACGRKRLEPKCVRSAGTARCLREAAPAREEGRREPGPKSVESTQVARPGDTQVHVCKHPDRDEPPGDVAGFTVHTMTGLTILG